MLPRKRILLIDNDEDTCTMFSIFLEAAYDVRSALTMADALELASHDRFDLYLIDIHLPDGNGLELFEQIRSFDASTPVIFCSGSSDELVQQQALQKGAHAFLIKPIDLDVLAETVICAIERQGSNNE